MQNIIHPKLELPFAAADALVLVAQGLAKAANSKVPRQKRAVRGATLRPGASTPMWNALAAVARSRLSVYGEKSRLARILGVPPQRVHDYLMAKSAMPDAERALLLLHWVAQRQAGRELG